MNEAKPTLLHAAIAPSVDEATAAWKAWRSAVDIQHLTWPEMQILPMLNGPQMEEWLAEDPAAGILRGIVRRAWSDTQVRLGLAREIVACLERAECGSVIFVGSIGAYLRNLQSTAIRPVLELRVLVPRQSMHKAAAALTAEGWMQREEIPTGEWLDRMSYVFFVRNGTRLHRHWRLFQVPIRQAAACERDVLLENRTVEAAGAAFRILTPEYALLEAIAGYEETVDTLAWQADAVAICRQPLDGRRLASRAASFVPQALGRIAELQSMGVSIPVLPRLRLRAKLWPPSAFVETSRRAASQWAQRLSVAMGRH